MTWKKYGFRHIAGEEQRRSWQRYDQKPMIVTVGKAICGNKYSYSDYVNVEDRPSYDPPWDHRDKRRPLCGACRKKWKKLWDQDLD